MFFLSHLVYQNDLHVRLRPIQKYHPAATFILIIDDDISKYQHLFSISFLPLYETCTNISKQSMDLQMIHRVCLVNCTNKNPI